MPEHEGRNVVITGGANGIGMSLVHAFHAQGAQVFFCDVDVRAGRALEKELGERAVFQKVDLTAEKEVVRWIAEIGRRHRVIHALINNAARDPRIPLKRASTKDWDELFATNLRACFLTCREAVKWMRAGSSIVNFSSITFHQGPANMSAYVATKGGVLGFTRSLARELGPRRIRVNTLSPGWVMTERQMKRWLDAEGERELERNQCLPDRLQPHDIARMILFLASDDAAMCTAQEFKVDAGWC